MVANFINNLLSQIGGGSKEVVYASVSENNLLEVIKIDPETNKIIKYGNRPLEYNDSTKEIKDYTAFKNTLLDLFKELNIPQKTNLYLSVPTVHVGKAELPSLLNSEGIGEALISEAEQNYIFKRSEPVISWFDITEYADSENKTILYSAIQRPAMENIQNVLTEAGITLVGIEPAIISTLRALKHLNKISEQIDNNHMWALMKISSTGYSLSTMYGEKIIEYYNEPLALKTYEGEEIYETIYASLQIALLNTQSDNLFIISETDFVSAENMSGRVPIDGEVTFIENNRFRSQQILDTEPSISSESLERLSIEAVGVGLQNISEYLINFNYLGTVSTEEEPFIFTFANREFVITEAVLKQYTLIAVLAFVVPSLLLLLIFGGINKSKQEKLNKLKAEIQNVENDITKLKKIESGNRDNFDENAEIERVLKDNKAKIKAYSALGESVPKNLWITYFNTKNDGKMDITGVSNNVEDIYIFYRNMKDSLLDSKLRLHKLKMESGSVEDAISSSLDYSFEITNMTDAELNPATEKSDSDDSKANKRGEKPANNANSNVADTNNNTSGTPATSGRKVKDLEEVEVH